MKSKKKKLKKFLKKQNKKNGRILFQDGIFRTDNPEVIEFMGSFPEFLFKKEEPIGASISKETLESLTNPILIEKKKSLEQSIEQYLEEQDILRKSNSNKIPMEFCVEITKKNKDLLQTIWRNFHDDRTGIFSDGFLHSNSLHTYCFASNVSTNDFKPVTIVSTGEFLRYIGRIDSKPKTYTEGDMAICFEEARLTHPFVGFKYQSFGEYLKSIE